MRPITMGSGKGERSVRERKREWWCVGKGTRGKKRCKGHSGEGREKEWSEEGSGEETDKGKTSTRKTKKQNKDGKAKRRERERGEDEEGARGFQRVLLMVA